MVRISKATILAIISLAIPAGVYGLQTKASSQEATSPTGEATPTPVVAYPEGWTGKEFNNLPPMIQSAEDFINGECRPDSLDHVQILNMQPGHNEPINIHVYCRKDKSASTKYKLSLIPVVGRRLGSALNPLLGRHNSRIVGFYFGKDGEDDDIMLLEKVQ